ncbi:MAG: ribose 5-phosphate isomerase B [Candidatus Diapherotrites archaeon]|nr:ribose 5-phosphate isomerase B [Candidatus Diapherotrites archaeon]
MKTIFLGSDHAGFELKEKLKEWLTQNKYEIHDLGTHEQKSCDFPDFAVKVAEAVAEDPEKRVGVLVCKTGQGMAMAANKVAGIRAALCYSEEIARLARSHNNANILCTGGHVIAKEIAVNVLKTFLETDFEGERHLNRINKLMKMEN